MSHFTNTDAVNDDIATPPLTLATLLGTINDGSVHVFALNTGGIHTEWCGMTREALNRVIATTLRPILERTTAQS